ncbi:MAG: NeuD/PglB/VioB family sugar acetyltransferase [Candidatus Accumulibacter sp.]|jgi:sugar O-acyltransferase (sialic acid O-acetyltransferase NeuD family)|nr:NeuD/PglB/VioB family sugar acetyltransferase [Accumulibacter sp.]
MKDIYILGAGGFGREVLNLMLDIHATQGQRWNIKGFLDDTEDPLRGKACDYSVVGTIDDYIPKKNEALVMAIANPAAKERISTTLKARGAVFESVVHPYAYLGRHNTLGEGAVVYGGFGMTVNVSVGNFPSFLTCGLGHDVTVGDYCTISSYCNIMGRVSIGHRVFIGGNVAIAPGVVIEDDAYVGAGSVVLKRVKAGEKVFGNPAREIGL